MSSAAEMTISSNESWDDPVQENFTCLNLCDGIMCNSADTCKNQYVFDRRVRLNGVKRSAYCKKAVENKPY